MFKPKKSKMIVKLIVNERWHTPKFFKEPKCGSLIETMKKEMNWDMFLNLQHLWGRRMC
jgi:hypothetical protein